MVRPLPVQALLDVGLLADDPGLQDREVTRRGGREPLCDELGEVAGEAGRARPARPAGVGPGHRGVEEPHSGRVRRELLDLDQHAAGESVQGAAGDGDLDVGQLALGQVRHPARAVLAAREQHPVVVDGAVVGAVVDVGVQAVLVGGSVEHAHAGFQGGAVRRRDLQPAGGRRERDLVVLQAEGGDQRRPVGRRHVVRGDAASGEEGPEVDRGAVDDAVSAAGPLHLK
jgi:hypothetical protein